MGLPYCGMPGDTLNVKIIRIADSRLWFYVWIGHTRLEIENFGSRKVMRFTRAAEQNNLRDWESDLWNRHFILLRVTLEGEQACEYRHALRGFQHAPSYSYISHSTKSDTELEAIE
jgi:hypothetical protein